MDKNQENNQELQEIKSEVGRLEDVVKNLNLPDEHDKKMSIIKNYLLLVFVSIALLAFLFAGYVLFFKVPKKGIVFQKAPEMATTSVSTNTATTTDEALRIEVIKEDKPWFEMSIEYPNIPVVKDFILEQYKGFTEDTKVLEVKNQKDAEKSLALISPDMQYSFVSTLSTTSSATTTSYIFETYTFTGGAHGLSMISAITLDEKNKVVDSKTILPDSALLEVSKIAKREIIKQKTAKLKSAGLSAADIKSILNYEDIIDEGTKPIRENYNSIWIDGDDLVIHFGQYQVGSYAEGTYDARINRNLITK